MYRPLWTIVTLAALSAPVQGCGDDDSAGDDDAAGDSGADAGTDTDTDTDPCTGVVTFPDPNLEAVVRGAIGKPTGDILGDDLSGLTFLDADSKNISDLTNIQCLASLTDLDLDSNYISDLSPLVGLIGLFMIDLKENQIIDIGPLVDNIGIGADDWVYIERNPLECDEQDMSDIQALRDRGVRVYHDC